ncbi:MAG TPA: hypothetical protein VME86_15250 [Acidobacteriaceae bacterium]|nr:hypothetical protein [Acidobacteriaceae bacterium]
MTKIGWFSWLRQRQPSTKQAWRIAGGAGLAVLLMTTGIAPAQTTAPGAQISAPVDPPSAPNGYSLHETIDMGGHMTSTTGSQAMYNTLVNIQSGPRVLGDTFELRALPGTKHTLVDSLSAYSDGFGGDPSNFVSLDFYKGNIYEFSGTFRRFREYFDYDLLGNPNIPSGQSIPIGPSNNPTGYFPWPQVNQSPFLYNTVRRITDTNLTLFPLSQLTYRFEYTQNVQEGPSLSPGGFIGSSDALLEEYQRNSTDDFLGGIDWKPTPKTKLTYEEIIDHYKGNSYFTLAPSTLLVQEANGLPVSLGGWDSLTPYSISSCNINSMGSGYTSSSNYTILSPPQSPGGKPVINPACDVISSYLRSQPTRVLFPTEIFRFQSSSIKNITMNGDVRYTNANMSLPNYYENFQGLDGTIRTSTYTGYASAKREVIAVDYGMVWDATSALRLSEQLTYSNAQQPGTAYVSKGVTANTPSTPGNETIDYSGPLTPGTTTLEGNPNGVPISNFFGQKYLTNDVTGTWDGWSRATLSLTYRYQSHIIAVGIPHSDPLPLGSVTNGTVTIHQNGGIFNAALRPNAQWDLSGSIELLYNDNTYTPVEPRQEQHYSVHTLYKPKSWITISGVFNDLEQHNNTNNNQDAVAAGEATYAGPIDHVGHSRVVSVGAVLMPNQHYGADFNYSYSDVYTATNICYDAAASSTLPGAATPSGTACPGAAVRGTHYYEFGPARDFMDAPTQYGSVAFLYSPINSIHSGIGYNITSVDGSRFFNDARDVNGSLVSTYQSPYVNLAWTVHKAWIWTAQYNFYGYGEGGPSGAPYCSTSNPTPTSPAPVVPCNDPSLAGLQTGLTISPAGETAPRNFHANVVTLGMRYEF